MAQYSFGAGSLYGTALTDANGNVIALPSPIKFGTLQEGSIEFNADSKTLFGENQFPVAVGRGKAKISGKAKFAQLNGAILNSLFFGQSMSNGIFNTVNDVTGTTIPATPFQITVTPPSSGTFGSDLGVRDSNGLPMTRVASAPATGQYTQAGAIYTFSAADTGKLVFISYQYTATSTTSKTLTIMNVAMGYAPAFQADFAIQYEGKPAVFRLFKCVASKLAFATKQDDFLIPEFDFEAFANPAGQVCTIGLAE